MSWRLVLHFFLVLAIGIFQVAFVSSLPAPFSQMNLILVVLLFLLLFDDLPLLFGWLIGANFITALTSHLPFGVTMAAMWLSVMFCYFLFYRVLTNRSLYALLLLVAIGTVMQELAVRIILWQVKLFTGANLYAAVTVNFFQQALLGVLLNVTAMSIVYYVLNFLNPRLKPFLLIKRR